MKNRPDNYSTSLLQADELNSLEIKYQSITDIIQFMQLKDDWEKLYSKATKPFFTQSYAWNLCCLKSIAEPRKYRLYCLVIRRGGQAVLIWPLVIIKQHLLWTVARPLALVSTEYSDVLVDTTDGKKITEFALQWIINNCPCDLIQAPFTRSDSLLFQAVDIKNTICSSTLVAPYVESRYYPNWVQYYESLNKDFKKDLSRRIRRLTEVGLISYELFTGKDAYQEELRWMLQTKRNWISETKQSWSPFTSGYEEFYDLVFQYWGNEGQVLLWVLKLDGKPLAAQLMRRDNTRIELLSNAYDRDYSKFSPDQILTLHYTKWAFDQNLIVDYRLGGASYKYRWTTGTCDVTNIEISRNLLGRIYIGIIHTSIKYGILSNLKKVFKLFTNQR